MFLRSGKVVGKEQEEKSNLSVFNEKGCLFFFCKNEYRISHKKVIQDDSLHIFYQDHALILQGRTPKIFGMVVALNEINLVSEREDFASVKIKSVLGEPLSPQKAITFIETFLEKGKITDAEAEIAIGKIRPLLETSAPKLK